MNINFSDTGKFKIDMVDYIRNIIDECTKNVTVAYPTPVSEDLFADEKGNHLLESEENVIKTVNMNIKIFYVKYSP